MKNIILERRLGSPKVGFRSGSATPAVMSLINLLFTPVSAGGGWRCIFTRPDYSTCRSHNQQVFPGFSTSKLRIFRKVCSHVAMTNDDIKWVWYITVLILFPWLENIPPLKLILKYPENLIVPQTCSFLCEISSVQNVL